MTAADHSAVLSPSVRAGPGTDLGRVQDVVWARLRDPRFWRIQILVATITAVHYTMEATLLDRGPFDHFHHVMPAFYIIPIIYASLVFRREGGLLTGLWVGMISVPNMFIWHLAAMEWLVEVVQIGIGVIVGFVLSQRVEYEASERRRAQQMASRLALVIRQITRAQEDERGRIARELHDDSVQRLLLIGRRLDTVLDTGAVPAGLRPSMQAIQGDVAETAAGLRRFSRDLRPSILDDLGLAAALGWLAKETDAQTGVSTQAHVAGPERRLTAEVELALFRIAQEALRNVEKHAQATQATIALTFSPQGVRLVVRDDGVGIPPAPSQHDLVAAGRLGLAGMHERAELIGGHLTVDSVPGGGTTVSVVVTD